MIYKHLKGAGPKFYIYFACFHIILHFEVIYPCTQVLQIKIKGSICSNTAEKKKDNVQAVLTYKVTTISATLVRFFIVARSTVVKTAWTFKVLYIVNTHSQRSRALIRVTYAISASSCALNFQFKNYVQYACIWRSSATARSTFFVTLHHVHGSCSNAGLPNAVKKRSRGMKSGVQVCKT